MFNQSFDNFRDGMCSVVLRTEPKVLIEKQSNKKARSARRRGIKKKDDEDGRKVVGGGSKSKGEKSAAKKSKLESGDEVIKGDNAPSREKSKIPMKRKRGADGGNGTGFLVRDREKFTEAAAKEGCSHVPEGRFG
ncbi:hypothetical protein PVL29_007223 [Vitis rotundifolia]|uniref:Uncharacterized protein n=1 Tax=Vitis rotundifolia TaxID=103349 RepID=A0AA38ZZ63_VITRO|nr:hypothetical protein PVL29_007223 [Vitis rotundifolia]